MILFAVIVMIMNLLVNLLVLFTCTLQLLMSLLKADSKELKAHECYEPQLKAPIKLKIHTIPFQNLTLMI